MIFPDTAPLELCADGIALTGDDGAFLLGSRLVTQDVAAPSGRGAPASLSGRQRGISSERIREPAAAAVTRFLAACVTTPT
ncbi:hypothetical protein ACQPZK_20890 [Micromonospora sp. CA-249363]|uniref:hypothetical protein n=1 Tax=Micromonospora sp. CA-249363 TaxID=3239963 RepID=UPI003D94EC7E